MMIKRKCHLITLISVVSILFVWLIISMILNRLEYKTPPLMVFESDINQYFNVSITKARIPRIIHQIYKTHEVPARWNSTVNSVVEMNKNDFKYRRWSDAEMHEFVKEYEYEFYINTYTKYSYNIQRVDSFRYVLMYHIGGIYIDMDNGCNRPFIDLINTLESLDSSTMELAAFPQQESFGVESDFLISSAYHPFYRQLISRLPLFNHNYILHFWTVLLSAGPIYVSIQERLYYSSKQSVIRLLDYSVVRPMFIRKENGFTWIHQDAHILFYFSKKIDLILLCSKISLFFFISFALTKWYRRQRKLNFGYFSSNK